MEDRDQGALGAALEEALQLEAEKRGYAVIKAIRPIIANNLKMGRVDYFLNEKEGRTPAGYVERVAEHYENLKDYVRQLQIEKSEEAWTSLFEQLQRWVYNFLVGKNFESSRHTFNLAVEYATEAAAALLVAVFPYDVTFDAWACILARNVTCKQLKQSKKASLTNGDNTLPLEEELAYNHHADSESDRKLSDLQRDLLDAIATLPSPTRQSVILLHYFYDLSFSEIAQELNQPINTVYQEHYRGRSDLRKILRQNGYKDARTIRH